jgi:superfamily II DNA or RNA helicase
MKIGQAHVLDVPFAMRAVATAGGARWDADHSAFVWRGTDLPPSLHPFRPATYSWETHVERELNDGEKRPASRAAGSITPRPHQTEAVTAIVRAHAAKRPGFLLADDVGLGKTITTWKAILELPKVETVLVVCPLAVVAHWRRTIEAMGDGGKDIVILNYDRLGKLFEVGPEARKKIRSKKGLARAGTAPELDVIVWDESHRCKNPTAARSKLAAKLVANAGFCLWLSATAGQNPLELSYLAPLLASVTGSRAADLKDLDKSRRSRRHGVVGAEPQDFEAWCQQQGLGLTRGTFGKWEWRGDAGDCAKVRALLFDAPRGAPAAGLRRRPENIAGWPEINRILTPIELTGDARELYTQAWTTFRKEMELAPRGRDPKSALAATLRLRQKGSLIRAAGTIELVHDLLANGHQVAISVAFIETLGAIRDALQADKIPSAEIHGAMPAEAREDQRLRFQRGDARVVLFTVEEGISLHQGEHNDVPRSEVIHDLRWSAIQMAQIEGRCHRDGRFAQVYWAYADDTIEDRIARIVAGRIQSMKDMIGDDVTTLREIERLLDNAHARA